jgi:uncharacterized protein (PEP-CTERM system associated)
MIDLARGPRRPAMNRLAGTVHSLAQRRALLKVGVVTTLVLATAPAAADQWKVEPGVSATITYTDNVALAVPSQAQGSFIAGITPRISVNGKGSRYSVNGTYALSGYFYTDAQQNDQYYSNLDLSGNVEAIERFFFVDGGVNIFQNFFSPLGPITIDNSLQTDNRYSTYVYRLSPYIQGNRSDLSYLLRWGNTWTDYSSGALNESYISTLIGRIGRPAGVGKRFGWQAEYNGSYVKYNNQDPNVLHLGRAILSYQVGPDLQVSARGGYEYNDYAIGGYSGAIYGAGLNWRPTPRTTLDGYWEHRFFGDSYSANFQHRTRLTGWRLTGSRGVTTSTQQFNLGTGIAYDVVDAAFLSRIPDTAQRQLAVQQFLIQTGLPTTLTQPLTFYSDQILLQDRVEAAFSIFGVRNSLVVTAYWTDQEPITGKGTVLPPAFNVNQSYNQQGASINFTHRLNPRAAFSLLALRNHTRYSSAVVPGTVDYTIFRAVLNSGFTKRASWFAGARYQWQDPSNPPYAQYREAAVYGGLNYTYR